jgi:hypothetical protein
MFVETIIKLMVSLPTSTSGDIKERERDECIRQKTRGEEAKNLLNNFWFLPKIISCLAS